MYAPKLTARRPAALLLAALLLAISSALGQVVPEGFTVEKVTDEVPLAVGCTFAADSSMFVWSKDGKVWLFREGQRLPEPLLDISEEVSSYSDLGLLGFALHPDFMHNGYFYVFYVVDRHHLLHYGTPQYDPERSDDFKATIGRITRFQADPAQAFRQLVPGSRKVLLGKDKQAHLAILHGSHSVGSLVFGEDGSLLASTGDGSTWEGKYTGGGPPYYNEDVPNALADGMMTEADDLGSYRSQMLTWHNGKILRLDPDSGAGLPDNPFYDPDDPFSAQSRVWALGLRNAYRFAVRPGTGSDDPAQRFPGTLYVGDVSAFNQEELNILTYPGANLGWPLYEGVWTANEYFRPDLPNPYAPNPLGGQDGCPTHFTFDDLVLNKDPRRFQLTNPCAPEQGMPEGTPATHHKLPDLFWKHHWSGPTTFVGLYGPSSGAPERRLITEPNAQVEGEMFFGSASIGGTFYTGQAFPESYRDAYYHVDYLGWIRRIGVDLNDTIQSVQPFLEAENNIVHLTEGPDGCLYYVQYPNAQGIYRVCYGRNVKPTAKFDLPVRYGPSPLQVTFRNESQDPNGDSLQYRWSFGDGSTSTEVHPTHIYQTDGQAPATFEATLEVTDTEGQTDVFSQVISLNNTPPDVRITSLRDGDQYADEGGLLLDLDQVATDAESPPADLSYRWTTYLHHNFHYHFDRDLEQPHGSLYISSVGCDESVPAVYYYRVQVEVTDPHGLSAVDSVFLYPDCATEVRFHRLNYRDGRPGTLDWRVESSEPMAWFEVQWSAGDWNFRAAGRLEPDPADLSVPTDFSLTDAALAEGTQFRVKYYTEDGAFGYSPVVSRGAPGSRLSILGNPVGEELRFQLADYIGPVRARIIDLQGRLIRDRELAPMPAGPYAMPLGNLPPATYLLQVEGLGATHTEKFIKAP